MRYIAIVLLFVFFSCKPKAVDKVVLQHDTVVVIQRVSDTMIICNTDSLDHVIDSLRTTLFLANYKIEKVKFYTRIVDKNPSQLKFYKGWIIRATK